MSFIGDLFGGGDAPKVDTKNITSKIATPFYNYNKGTLTQNPGAASPSSFSGIFKNLGENAQSVMGLRSQLPGMQANIQGFGKDLASLRSQVAPGFGRLTQARVQTIRDAAATAIGDLRTQLSRRGVMGSSFASDAENRAKLAFAQEEESARAQSIIEEIGMSADLIKQQVATEAASLGITGADAELLKQSAVTYQAQAQVLGTQIAQQLQQLGVAANIANGLNSVYSDIAIQQSKLDMAAQIQQQQAMGLIAGQALKGFGTGVFV